MTHKYTLNIWNLAHDADVMLKGIEAYKRELERKTTELCKRCAEIGATVAAIGFSGAIYTGNQAPPDIGVQAVDRGYKVYCNGEAVWFIEFGAGATYGYGHPEAAEHGMGPGTFPPTNPDHPHWNDPKGWYLPKSAGGGHTYGNPPNAPMYRARKDIEEKIKTIVQEVFAND